MYRNTMGTMPNLQNHNGNDADLNATETNAMKVTVNFTMTFTMESSGLKFHCRVHSTFIQHSLHIIYWLVNCFVFACKRKQQSRTVTPTKSITVTTTAKTACSHMHTHSHACVFAFARVRACVFFCVQAFAPVFACARACVWFIACTRSCHRNLQASCGRRPLLRA